MKNKKIYPWVVVGLLWVVALLNYMDRQMLSTMQEAMKVDIVELNKAEAFGALMAVFLWIYGFMSPVAGVIADRVSRKWLIVGSLFVWSAVTYLMGYATDFHELYWLRATMGVSEALYIPSALSLIADWHQDKSRSLAIGIHMTVLYTSRLPEAFKKYAAHISIVSSSIQYENDDVMKPVWGDDYSICCCVSATQTGKEMQFFGARANLAKCLLYAINGGVDEKSHEQCGPNYAPITSEYLTYDEVLPKYVQMLDWLAGLYVNVLNLIQYMHDKYYYEEAEMALIDTDVRRTFATGIAGFSHVIDSLSAIKYAKVKVVRDETGLATGFETEGDFPKYGNDDDRADEIGVWLLKTFLEMIKKRHTYRNSEATTSILTITSNVVYGKYTGALPDGRAAFTPFAPGATPSYGAEQNGLLASLNSVAKLPYHWALDGISNTQTINPEALGHSEGERVENLVQVLEGYYDQGAHHLNVNVFGKEKLLDAMEHPEKEEYANFTIRVSGYAVKFIDLTREQQLDVLARTCHGVL